MVVHTTTALPFSVWNLANYSMQDIPYSLVETSYFRQFHKGMNLYHLSRYEEAMECLNQAGRLDPDNPEIQFARGRTFQRMELFDSLSVRENVSLGREAGLAGLNPWRHVSPKRRDRADIEDAVNEAIELCGLEEIASRRVGSISTGQRRLVELASTIAGRFRILLLDEPSSGLDANETRRFGDILRTVIARDGTGILLVEHDMSLVMDVCEFLHVIDFGELIFRGTVEEVVASDVVRAAYLGTAAAGAA